MATTANHSIYYPTSGDPVTPLESVFATQASSTDAALTTVNNKFTTFGNRRVGTEAQRTALVAPDRFTGLEFYQTNGTAPGNYVWNGTAWASASGGGVRRGTGAQRASTTSQYWDFWLDTDGTQKLYVGDKAGGWRQYSGSGSVAAGAWDAQGSGSGMAIGVRNTTATLPTSLATNETLMLSSTTVGGIYATISLTATTASGSNTIATIRHMAFQNLTQTAFSFVWQIAPI